MLITPGVSVRGWWWERIVSTMWNLLWQCCGLNRHVTFFRHTNLYLKWIILTWLGMGNVYFFFWQCENYFLDYPWLISLRSGSHAWPCSAPEHNFDRVLVFRSARKAKMFLYHLHGLILLTPSSLLYVACSPPWNQHSPFWNMGHFVHCHK